MLISSYEQRIKRSADKTRTVLYFLRDETWSSADVLAKLLGLSKTGIYKTLLQLESKGYIRSQLIEETKRKLYGITSKGLLYAWDENEQMQDRPCFEPSKVKATAIQHYLDTQVARLNSSELGWTHWTPGHLLPKGIAKRPDAVVTNNRGNAIAIELERTVKSRKRYEAIFAIYLQMIKRGDFSAVHYICPTEEFASRLRRLFSLLEAVPIAGQRIRLNDQHKARFPVYSLQAWPPKT